MNAGKYAKRKLSQLFGLATGLAVFGSTNAVIVSGFLAAREGMNANPETGFGPALAAGLCTAALVALTVPLSKKFGRMASAKLHAKLDPKKPEDPKAAEASANQAAAAPTPTPTPASPAATTAANTAAPGPVPPT